MGSPNNIVWILIAYLIGSIPSAYLITKRVRGIDIREHGSGNVGATNVFRVVGKSWGSVVLLSDFCKGWLVTALLAPAANAFPELAPAVKQLIFGFAAVAGHTWSPWLKLKGGKGVAVSAGSLAGIFPFATALATIIWGICFLIKRYVSLASVVAVGTYPILLLLFHRDADSFGIVFVISLALAALLIYNHRSNLDRLKRGEEPQVSFGPKKDSSPSS